MRRTLSSRVIGGPLRLVEPASDQVERSGTALMCGIERPYLPSPDAKYAGGVRWVEGPISLNNVARLRQARRNIRASYLRGKRAGAGG